MNDRGQRAPALAQESLLPIAVYRGLNDRLYDKRKVAALEIQRLAKEWLVANQHDKIEALIRLLRDEFCLSPNSNARKGGLIGLAGMAIALEQESTQHLRNLIPPVLGCFSDSDSRVRYYACEALYNIAKVGRARILIFFNEIFDGLSKLAADPDPNVRQGVDLLDRLVKDIVTESTSFNIEKFIPLLKERIYTTNTFVRQFIVSWITILDSVPDIELLDYLQDFLDGLMRILSDENDEIRKLAETQLAEFLREIRATGMNYKSVVGILVAHCSSKVQLMQYTAITWLKEFIVLAGQDMLPYGASLLAAILPLLSHTVKQTRDVTVSTNQALMHLFEKQDPRLGDTEEQSAVLNQIVDTLRFNLDTNESTDTRVACLRWIFNLLRKYPKKIFAWVDTLLPSLLKGLSDPSDKVVKLDLEVLAELAVYADTVESVETTPISHDLRIYFTTTSLSRDLLPLADGPPQQPMEREDTQKPSYFARFMVSLLELFSNNRELLEERGAFIVCQLCLLLNPERIYQTLAEILLKEEDLEFARRIVHNLNAILLTAPELKGLRDRLKNLQDKESRVLYVCLYRSWSHNPIATFSLCLLSQTYQHASDLLSIFADMEVTVEFLMDIDRLVQLLESPIFTYLRLQLLELERHPYLAKCLYGILMLLPQSRAYKTLSKRLQAVPHYRMPPSCAMVGENPGSVDGDGGVGEGAVVINFDALLRYFRAVRDRHVQEAAKARKFGK